MSCRVVGKKASSFGPRWEPFFRIDVRRALSAMQFLRIKLPVYHSDERRCLFPLLKQRAPHSSGIVPIIAQLLSHQIEDEDFAHEVAEFLEDLSTEPVIRNPDASGYLLRGFFQSYRRYLGWQKLMVLPLANRVLSREDLDHLFAAINFNRKSAEAPTIYLEPTVCTARTQ